MAEKSVNAHPDPGERGALTIADKVAQRIAAQAALDTPGVHRHGAGLSKLTGRALPQASVLLSRDRVRAQIDIAARWPTSLPQLTAAVRRNVANALTTMAGLHVDGVDVHTVRVVNPTAERRSRL